MGRIPSGPLRNILLESGIAADDAFAVNSADRGPVTGGHHTNRYCLSVRHWICPACSVALESAGLSRYDSKPSNPYWRAGSISPMWTILKRVAVVLMVLYVVCVIGMSWAM